MKLGDKLKDKVTGFEGIAVAKIEYLNGCCQYCIKPQMHTSGKMPNGEYIDVQQLEVVKSDSVIVEAKETGGDHPDAPDAIRLP